MNKTELLNKFSKDPEERVVLARALDQMDRAANRSIPCATQFLSPAQRAALELVLASFTSLTHVQAHGFARSAARPLPTRPASLGPRGGPLSGKALCLSAGRGYLPAGGTKFRHNVPGPFLSGKGRKTVEITWYAR